MYFIRPATLRNINKGLWGATSLVFVYTCLAKYEENMSTERTNPNMLNPAIPLGCENPGKADLSLVEGLGAHTPKIVEGAYQIQDPEIIHLARQLTARSYLKSGFVNLDDIDSDGVIVPEADPYVDSSDYYIVANKDSQIVATTRKIRFTKTKGEDSFPVWRHKAVFDQDAVAEIESIGLKNCVEISALSKESELDTDKMAALRLYRSIVHDALIKNSAKGGSNEQVFLMASSPRLHTQLTALFDGGIRQIGPPLDYPGEEVIPATFHPEEGMVKVIEASNDPANPQADLHKFVADFILDGLSAEEAGPRITNALNENALVNTLANLAEDRSDSSENLKRKLKIGAFSLATIGIIAFEQLPTNESVRTMIAFDTLDKLDSAVLAGLAVGAATMAIESSASTAVAYGLNHESMGRVQAYIRARREKRLKGQELDRTKADAFADLTLAVSIGPAIAVAKRHYEDGPGLKRDILRGLGYSAIGAALSAGIAYTVTGGAKHAEKIGLEKEADFAVNLLSDWKFWAAAMTLGYVTSKFQKAVKPYLRKKGEDNVV